MRVYVVLSKGEATAPEYHIYGVYDSLDGAKRYTVSTQDKGEWVQTFGQDDAPWVMWANDWWGTPFMKYIIEQWEVQQ